MNAEKKDLGLEAQKNIRYILGQPPTLLSKVCNYNVTINEMLQHFGTDAQKTEHFESS